MAGWKLMLVFLLIFNSSLCFAEENKSLITVGPAWDRFTNKDGTGLYHDIIRQIFQEYSVQHVYVPTPQANAMVTIGRADIKMCETVAGPSLQIAHYPMYENTYYVVYLREHLRVWRGSESLRNKRLAWRKGYYSQQDFEVPVQPIEVTKGESALQMVNHGRADFYVDDMTLIKETFAELKMDLDDLRYGFKLVGARSYYPVFATTPRGNELCAHYDTEMQKLVGTKVLEQLYRKYGFPVPRQYFQKKRN